MRKIEQFMELTCIKKMVYAQLSKLVDGLRTLTPVNANNYLHNHRAIGCLTSSGKIVCGVTLPHELPKQSLSAMQMCHAILTGTGSYGEVIGVWGFYKNPRTTQLVTPIEVSLLSMHRHPGIKKDELICMGRIEGVKDDVTAQLQESTARILKGSLVESETPLPADPLRKEVLQLLTFSVPRSIDPKIDCELLKVILKTHLQLSYRNSNSDGKGRPGRKRHSAAVFSLVTMQGGSVHVLAADACQTRHQDDPQLCSCAESNGALILFGLKCALLGGIKVIGLDLADFHAVDRITHTFVFSEGYSAVINGKETDLAPETCDSCISHLTEFLPCDAKGMQLIGFGNNEVISVRTLNSPAKYAVVDRLLAGGGPTNGH